MNCPFKEFRELVNSFESGEFIKREDSVENKLKTPSVPFRKSLYYGTFGDDLSPLHNWDEILEKSCCEEQKELIWELLAGEKVLFKLSEDESSLLDSILYLL